MHYVDEGSGAPVLLLHGEPTWAFLYRKMIPTIAVVARAVAPDYFGFGRSDKPTRIEDYSYDFHYASIERFADELDLRDATVVVQDWGGPIGLRLAVERPDRVAAARDPQYRSWGGTGSFGGVAAIPGVRPPSRNRPRSRPAHPHLGRHGACGRRCGGLQRAVPDTGVESRRARVSRARPDRGRPSERREDDGGTSCARTMGAPGTRPLLRLRPDLLDDSGRAHGVTHPGRRPGRDRSPAPVTSCRRRKARRSPSGSSAS